MRIFLALALAAVVGTSQVSATGWTEREATRETMQTIFDSLRFLLRLDAAGENFDDPKYRSQVLEALRELDDQSAILASHGFYEDSGGMFLAGVLERYTLLLLRTYERGEPEQLQQFLYGITDICIACHSRLPSPQDSPVAVQFVDSREFASLGLWKRAKLQVATRRFDDALATLEALIESQESADPAAIDDPLRIYLMINIRVKGDMERPIPILERISEQAEAGSEWQRDVEIWTQSLEHFRDQPFISDPLASARAMIASAGSAEFPSQRSARVEYIAASSLLHRYLVSRPSESLQVSEAHYLLGLAEYRIHPDEWLPHAELYLEIAIVLAPEAPWAKSAYALLVEKINQTYKPSTSGGLPPEVEERLRELQQAIDGVAPESASSREPAPLT
jgi:tetratricopeptide (TPR) repeat protein